MSGRRLAVALASLLVLGAGGYAIASPGTPRGPDAARASCASGQLLSITGRVPPGVAQAFLVWASGASLQVPVRDRKYRFVFQLPSTRSALPLRLEYLDAGGLRHEETLGRSLPRCAPVAVAGAAAGRSASSNSQTSTRRRPGQSAASWATTLDNRATVHVQTTDASCNLNRLVPPPQPTTLSQGSPSPALLGLLGVLRRAPTASELALNKPGGVPFGPPAVLTVFQRYTRIINGPNGLVATITVGEGRVSLPAIALPPCQQKINSYLEHLLRPEPRDVKFYARELRRYFKIGPLNFGVRPWLRYSVGRAAESGGGGGPFDVEYFRTHGILESGSLPTVTAAPPAGPQPQIQPSATLPRPRGLPLPRVTLLAGLVPDGVASVTLNLPAHVSHGSALVHQQYPQPYTATARVTDNAYFLPIVPRDTATAAQRSTIVWRTASGRVIRVIRNR